MIKIDGKEIRTESEQVWKNMEDINKLQDTIKPEYTTAEALTSSSTSVAIANTNAPSGTKSGWLLTHDGLKFKITGGDDTNLLLEFYTNLKGPQGNDGAALNIDDNVTSLTKVWSSSKTANTISSLIRDDAVTNLDTWSSYQQNKLLSSGIAWTTTDKDGDDQISLSNIYIGSRTAYESLSIIKVPQLKVDDLIVYVDGDLNAKTLYRVSSITGSSATVAKVCDFSQGNKLYKHNILAHYGTSPLYYVSIQIETESATQLTMSDVLNWLYEKGFVGGSGLESYPLGYVCNSSKILSMGISSRDGVSDFSYTNLTGGSVQAAVLTDFTLDYDIVI